MEKFYIQHEGKVVETNDKFKHVMAITLDETKDYKEGIIRCVVNREGDIQMKGYIDRSELYKIKGDSLYHFEIVERLNIKNEKEIINDLITEDFDFIGLEDPDIWRDQESGLMHLYFTIPFIVKNKEKKNRIHLGHAVGKDLDSLEMTKPVLISNDDMNAKEVSIAPVNKKGFRFNLIESKSRIEGVSYSVIQVAVAKDMNTNWELGDVVFHPAENHIKWIEGHASPGSLFPKSFIDMGEGKLLGVMNGREANQKLKDNTIKYGMFSVGLFIYDYENGKIDWVSEEPFIQDSEAITITFASQFVETKEGEGVLYAQVDDSFIRTYTLKRDEIKKFLINKINI